MAGEGRGRLSVTVLRAVKLGPSGAEEGEAALSEPFCTLRLRDGAGYVVPSDRLVGSGGAVDWRSTVAFATVEDDAECSLQLHDAALLPGCVKPGHSPNTELGPVAKMGRLLSLLSVGASLDLPPEMDGYGERSLCSERAGALMAQPSLIGSVGIPLAAARKTWADCQQITLHCTRGQPVARVTLLLGYLPLRMSGYMQLRTSPFGGWRRCRAELCANAVLFLYNTTADRARPDLGVRVGIQLKDVTVVDELPGKALGIRLEVVTTNSRERRGKQKRQMHRYDLRVPQDCGTWLRCLKEQQKVARREMPKTSVAAAHAFLERLGVQLPS